MRPPVPASRSRPLLAQGGVLGIAERRLHLGSFTLVESRYAPDTVLPLHAHATVGFRLTLGGAFVERAVARDGSVGPSRGQWHDGNAPPLQSWVNLG